LCGEETTQFKLATPLSSAVYSRDGREAVLSAGDVTIWSTELADGLPALERIAKERGAAPTVRPASDRRPAGSHTAVCSQPSAQARIRHDPY